ncbi:MAG: hypothetical protein Alis3KO_26210 [Aliiglaciecola sp.]|uniref:DUF3718 domain-containing protein n=1 Tax=Aliiglaciecola sp. M165 TaxID=2593649 RepID=UPI00117C273F|nr:DUF3718 domain-containing protein [Aliiglaciecola sp. M165]TRY30738.1 DUF3718 domain-containing protein [Aliiglaciecola sp. M165]
MKNVIKAFNVKNVLGAAALTLLFVSVSASANAGTRLDKSTEAKLVKICHALKSDSRIRLHRTVKQSRLGYKQIAEGLKCNGKSAMDFALFNDANNTAGFLAKKANIKHEGMLAKR